MQSAMLKQCLTLDQHQLKLAIVIYYYSSMHLLIL